VTLVIGDTGAYEFVSYRTIGEFAGKGKLLLTEGKLGAKSEKGGQMTLQFYVDPGTSERCLKLMLKIKKGSPIPQSSNGLEPPSRQYDVGASALYSVRA
jgi:hypothetical protein